MTGIRTLAWVLVFSSLLALTAGAGLKAVEGDILEVDGKRYRLIGIDAPHLDQNCLWPNKVISCGRITVTALKDLITAAKVACEPVAGSAPGARSASRPLCR